MTVDERSDADTPAQPDVSFEQLARRVDDARRAVDAFDTAEQRRALELAEAIEAFHRPALVTMVQALRADPRGKELLFQLVDDPGVRAVFALHGIIKADPMTRANQALASVRPYLQSHGGDVALVRIADGAAFVRLEGSCSGCSMSAVTLREGVEEALVTLPEVDRIEVLDDEPTAAFIPIDMVGRKPSRKDTGWVEGPPTDAVADGDMLRFDVRLGDTTESFVVTNTEQRFAVFRNACVHQGLTLDGGLIDDGVIICPWHSFKFEAATGECISAPGAQLEQVPTRIDHGHVWIRAGGD